MKLPKFQAIIRLFSRFRGSSRKLFFQKPEIAVSRKPRKKYGSGDNVPEEKNRIEPGQSSSAPVPTFPALVAGGADPFPSIADQRSEGRGRYSKVVNKSAASVFSSIPRGKRRSCDCIWPKWDKTACVGSYLVKAVQTLSIHCI